MPHTIKSIIEKLSEEFNLSEEGEKKLKSSLTSLLDSIKTDIKKTKEEVKKQTGSYKYDDQYDDCINIINSHK
jgi:ElaB/YqjD/DUF883 family membrane-anchored ribosome-binding protein